MIDEKGQPDRQVTADGLGDDVKVTKSSHNRIGHGQWAYRRKISSTRASILADTLNQSLGSIGPPISQACCDCLYIDTGGGHTGNAIGGRLATEVKTGRPPTPPGRCVPLSLELG